MIFKPHCSALIIAQVTTQKLNPWSLLFRCFFLEIIKYTTPDWLPSTNNNLCNLVTKIPTKMKQWGSSFITHYVGWNKTVDRPPWHFFKLQLQFRLIFSKTAENLVCYVETWWQETKHLLFLKSNWILIFFLRKRFEHTQHIYIYIKNSIYSSPSLLCPSPLDRFAVFHLFLLCCCCCSSTL